MGLSLQKSSAAEVSVQASKKTISVFVAGIGAVGSTLLHQLRTLEHSLYEINVLGVCNSKNTQWNPDLEKVLDKHLAPVEHETDWNSIPEELIRRKNGNLVFIDATGSEVVARQYQKLLEHGIHVATPSKRANTFEQTYFDDLLQLNADGVAEYRYETTVGAGLPIISTIKSLIDSGDEITEISGVASGTMTYVFTQLQNGLPFSEIIRLAKEKGYSEPDPRDDLSGEDVARKFLILARTSGFKFERDQIKVKTLVPEELIEHSTNEFLEELKDYDGHWKNRNTKALVNNKKLRYVGSFTPDGIEIGIREVGAESPLGGLKGTDNLLQIHTKRYSESPIVIQGPGAGKEVTAAGVLADVIDIAKNI